jgi:hypothetical protein
MNMEFIKKIFKLMASMDSGLEQSITVILIEENFITQDNFTT